MHIYLHLNHNYGFSCSVIMMMTERDNLKLHVVQKSFTCFFLEMYKGNPRRKKWSVNVWGMTKYIWTLGLCGILVSFMFVTFALSRLLWTR